MKGANFFPEMGKSTFHGGPLIFEPDRLGARTHVSLDKATPGARDIAYRHATRALRHVELQDAGTALPAAVRGRMSFDVSRRATCVVFGPARILAKRRPAHSSRNDV